MHAEQYGVLIICCVSPLLQTDKHRRWYSMARSQIRPRIGVRCGP